MPRQTYQNPLRVLYSLFLETVSQLDGQIQVIQKKTSSGKSRRKTRTVTRRRELSGTPAEQWNAFVSEAPQRTQDFVNYIKDKQPDFLMQSDAMDRLGMTPRAIGGLTGTLRRWAMADGVPLPWVATRIDGNRAWLWCGFDEEGNLNSPPAKFASVNAQNLPPTSYEEFYARLPERSQKFLDFLRDVGQCTVSQAMSALDIDSPKTLGGLAGSLNRWGRAAQLPVPFKQVRIQGQKGYRWAASSSDSDAPLSAPDSDRGVPGEKPLDWDHLKASVPGASQQFLDRLQRSGRMSQREVLSAFGLARAQSINKLLDPITEYLRERGLTSPVIEEFDGVGQRSFLYREADSVLTESPAPTPNEALSEDPKPGVRIRRRTS